MSIKLIAFLILGLFASGILFVACKKTNNSSPSTEVKDQKIVYTCPMHPEVHQDHPGECPICHMKLEPKK